MQVLAAIPLNVSATSEFVSLFNLISNFTLGHSLSLTSACGIQFLSPIGLILES